MTAKKATPAKKAKPSPVKKATPREGETKPSPRNEYPRAFEAGKTARANAIPKNQAPVFVNNTEKQAWMEGWGDD